MEIRTAQASDAARFAELFDQLGYPDAAAALGPRLVDALADPRTLVLSAVCDGQVAGVLAMNFFAPLHVPHSWAVISSLVVDAGMRSEGAGAALVAEAERRARAMGCAHVELSCSERRTRAHEFYAAQGFEEVRKRLIKKFKG